VESLIFKLVLFASTVIAFSRADFISIWLAVEVNSICFIVIIENRARAKYFMSQWLGSFFVMLGLIFSRRVFVLVGAFVKLGMAPFHAWFPQVIVKLSWLNGGVLCTWQKLAPLRLVVCSRRDRWLIQVVSGLTAVIGRLGSIKESKLRAIIAYSSISNMG